MYQSLIKVLLIEKPRALLDVRVYLPAKLYRALKRMRYLHLMLWTKGSLVFRALRYSFEFVTTTGWFDVECYYYYSWC